MTFSRTRRVASGQNGLRGDAPGPLEDFRQNQHGHVAAHAVALAGDFHQLADHGFLRGRVAVIELQACPASRGNRDRVRGPAAGRRACA